MESLVRKNQILNAAIKVSLRKGCYRAISRDSVAIEAKVSRRVVNKYFGTMDKLKDAILQFAIEFEIFPIIIQGMVLKDPGVKKASKELIIKALSSMKGKNWIIKLK